jgi:hypothetical protein
MPLMFQANTLQMQWCLDCHRNVQANLREKKDVFDMDWKPGPDQAEKGQRLAAEYQIRSVRDLTSCSTCHR